MKIKAKEFKLDELTSQELEETGYAIFGNGEYCIVKDSDGEYTMFKLFEDYTNVKLNCDKTEILDVEVED